MNSVIILTTHNPKEELIKYIEELLSACVPHVIIVDDGSDNDSSRPVFQQLRELPGCTVLTCGGNTADAAMRTGYRYYEQHLKSLGYMQLYAADATNSRDREKILTAVGLKAEYGRKVTLRDLAEAEIAAITQKLEDIMLGLLFPGLG